MDCLYRVSGVIADIMESIGQSMQEYSSNEEEIKNVPGTTTDIPNCKGIP